MALALDRNRTRSARLMSFATWSRRFTVRISRSFRTAFTITPWKGTNEDQLCTSVSWETAFVTFWRRTGHGMPTTAIRAMRSMRTIRLSAA